MTTRRRRMAGILIVVGAMSFPIWSAERTSFAALRAKALRQQPAPEYEARMAKAMETVLTSAIHGCELQWPISRPTAFESVLTLGRNGEPLKVDVNSDDEAMKCIGARLESSTFPEPPFDRYLAYFKIKLRDTEPHRK